MGLVAGFEVSPAFLKSGVSGSRVATLESRLRFFRMRERGRKPIRSRRVRVPIQLLFDSRDQLLHARKNRKLRLLSAYVSGKRENQTVNVLQRVFVAERHHLLPNVKDEPRSRLARAVLLGARIVTAVVVGSGALLGFWLSSLKYQVPKDVIGRNWPMVPAIHGV
jgi:hypothetical protein